MVMSDRDELPIDGEQAGLTDALVQSAFITMAVLNKVAADHDLSLTQLRVLGILRDRRLRMAVLADFLGLDRSTLTGLVDRAERRGLVERSSSPTDGRAVEVFLSPEGMKLAARIHDRVRRSLMTITDELAPVDRRRLRVLLERIRGPHQP